MLDFVAEAAALAVAAPVAADHDGVDHAAFAAAVPPVVDTRGVCARLGSAADPARVVTA